MGPFNGLFLLTCFETSYFLLFSSVKPHKVFLAMKQHINQIVLREGTFC